MKYLLANMRTRRRNRQRNEHAFAHPSNRWWEIEDEPTPVTYACDGNVIYVDFRRQA